MREFTSAEQRMAITERVRDDVADLLENINLLEKRGLQGVDFDAALELAYFVGFAHYITAIMTLGHNKALLSEVHGSSQTYTKKVASFAAKRLRVSIMGRWLAVRMCHVRRSQYLEDINDRDATVEVDEIVKPLISRVIRSNSCDESQIRLIKELWGTVSDYLVDLETFYGTKLIKV